MATLARMVAATGIKRVTGDLSRMRRRSSRSAFRMAGSSRYLESGYAARVSALSMNENLATVVDRHRRLTAGAAAVNLDPPSTTVPVTSNVRTVVGSKAAKLSIRRQPDGRVDVRGWIGSTAGSRSYLVVIDDPPPWVAGMLRSALAAQGVTVSGQVKAGGASASATSVASLASPPLTRLASAMNRESINHFAELLFRDVAQVSSPDHIGSAEFGNTVLKKFMTDKVGATATDVMASRRQRAVNARSRDRSFARSAAVVRASLHVVCRFSRVAAGGW